MTRKVIKSPFAPDPIGPYSQAIKCGKILFISGQIAYHKASGKLITGNIINETSQVMKNLNEILYSAGMDFSDIVKSTIFLTDLEKFSEVNKVYGSYFLLDPPARETVQVSRLPKDANVEISCIAIRH